MARVKRAQTTTTGSTAKPVASPSAQNKNGNGHASVDLQAAIQARAYELYERRGRRDGFAQDDWFKAEAELRSTRTA